tara:strand:- start:1956 stop:2375 length:420 start_codon:yes stop_codon:yes gene_type:complete
MTDITKTILCKFQAEHKCNKGEGCKYWHTPCTDTGKVKFNEIDEHGTKVLYNTCVSLYGQLQRFQQSSESRYNNYWQDDHLDPATTFLRNMYIDSFGKSGFTKGKGKGFTYQNTSKGKGKGFTYQNTNKGKGKRSDFTD